MKKAITLILSAVIIFSLCACAKPENRADTSLKEGEIMLSGYVAEATENTILLEKCDGYDWENYVGERAYVTVGSDIQFVVDGCYVTDLTADYFKGKYISVICSELVLETYPVQLQNERMIILLDS